MARSMVGSICHKAEASTAPGYWPAVSITLPITFTPRSTAASETPKRSAYITSAPASIIAKALSLALGGSYQLLMKLTRKRTSGFTLRAPSMKACISRLTSGMA